MTALFEIPKGSRITAIVAHPDDETIGPGAALARFAREGASCRAVLAFHRTDSRLGDSWPRLVETFRDACGIIKCEASVLADLPESREGLDIQRLHDALIEEVASADLVLTHWSGDTHQAHRALAYAVEICTRPFRRHRHLWFFETPTSSDQGVGDAFSPNLCVQLTSDDVAMQKRAMALYPGSEASVGRTPDDLEAHARYRGRQNGCEYAAVFRSARMFF